jgi:hypothetical protein
VTHPAEREAVASTEPASLLSAARARTPARVFRGLGPVVAERRLLALLDAIHAAGRSGVTVKEPSEPANAGAVTS